MSHQPKRLIVPFLACLLASLASVQAAETLIKEPIKKPALQVNKPKSTIKAIAATPDAGVGADEHGCIPPGVWHEPAKACVTDILPGGGSTQDGMQTE